MQDQSLYTLSEVVQLIGIPKRTLHTWERRHRAFEAVRSQNNRQLYGENDVYRLHLLSQLVNSGEPIGSIASLSLSELEAKLSQKRLNERSSAQDFIGIIQELDQATLDRKLAEYFMARGPINFAQDVVLPTLREIGRQWADGTVSVSSEHLFTASARSLLGLALNQGPAQSEDITMMFTTPAGEPHELGVLAAAVAAKNRGIRVIYLGPQLPPEEMLQAAEQINADIVCLGSVVLRGQALFNQIDQVLAALPANRELWLGGNPSLVSEISSHPQLQFFHDLEAFENALRIKTLLSTS